MFFSVRCEENQAGPGMLVTLLHSGPTVRMVQEKKPTSKKPLKCEARVFLVTVSTEIREAGSEAQVGRMVVACMVGWETPAQSRGTCSHLLCKGTWGLDEKWRLHTLPSGFPSWHRENQPVKSGIVISQHGIPSTTLHWKCVVHLYFKI